MLQLPAIFSVWGAAISVSQNIPSNIGVILNNGLGRIRQDSIEEFGWSD